MNNDPIVITGIGMLDANGSTPDQCWTNILAGTTVPVVIDDTEKYNNVKVKRAFSCEPYMNTLNLEGLDARTLRTIPRLMAMAYHVSGNAIKDSGIGTDKNAACIFTSIGESRPAYRYLSNSLDSGVANLNPFKALWATISWLSGFIGSEFKLTGPNFQITAACASGLTALYTGANLLKADPTIEYALVGSADEGSDRSFRYFFQLINALSTDDADNCSRPFDTTRNGFVGGDGACAMILERKSSALARGATIYGELAGFGNYKENGDSTSPNKDGIGSKFAISAALLAAGVTAADIDYVNAHATSTPAGDDVETDSIEQIIGHNVPVSSNKSTIGHTFAAAGMLETAYSLLTMKYNTIPKNVHLTDPCNTNLILPTETLHCPINTVLKNSFAFNGRCVSLILKK